MQRERNSKKTLKNCYQNAIKEDKKVYSIISGNFVNFNEGSFEKDGKTISFMKIGIVEEDPCQFTSVSVKRDMWDYFRRAVKDLGLARLEPVEIQVSIEGSSGKMKPYAMDIRRKEVKK